jgi:hypothetical protein
MKIELFVYIAQFVEKSNLVLAPAQKQFEVN